MRRALLALATACALTPGAALAQGSVKGLKIVVPDARGKAAYGKAALTKTLRRALTEAIGPLVPSSELTAAQKKLKQKGKRLEEPDALAEAARLAGAQYVLAVEILKEKWLYTARAMLINAETAQVQMDFRSQFHKPRSEADDRGKRIGARTIQKLEQLLSEGPAPAIGAVAEARPRAGGEGPAGEGAGGGPGMGDRLPRGAESDDLKEDRRGGGELATRTAETPRIEAGGSSGGLGSGGSSGGLGAAGGSSSSAGGGFAASNPGSAGLGGSSSGSGARTVVSPVEPEADAEYFRATLIGGAGILRTYDLSAPGVDASQLSYRLNPLGMVGLELESAPGIPIGLTARASFRPVRYQINLTQPPPPSNGQAPAAAEPEDNTPAGSILEAAAVLSAHVAVSGEGRRAFKLIPGLGIKVDVASVESHAAAVIVSSTMISPVGSLVFRMPINNVLELQLGVDGGPVLSFSESPVTTGVKAGGSFVVGGDFRARVWLSSALAIAFDTRFDLAALKLSERGSRQPPPNETLENASIQTKDLRTGIGLAVRL